MENNITYGPGDSHFPHRVTETEAKTQASNETCLLPNCLPDNSNREYRFPVDETTPTAKEDHTPPTDIMRAINEATERSSIGTISFEQARNRLEEAGLIPEKVSDILARQPTPVDWIITDILAARGNSERGFKGDIIAPPKKRKTFFGLQLASNVSAGRDLFDLPQFHIPKPRNVLYVNLELRKDFGEERFRKIAAQFGANFDKLYILTPTKPYLLRNKYDKNGNWVEGCENEFIVFVREMCFELIIADPEYKLLFPEEDENSGQGIGGILRWRDRIITETRASCLLVHHDNKSGGIDKDITQRGAGSGYGGRDYDVRFALSDHVKTDEDDSIEILECGSRVRTSPEDLTIIFNRDSWMFKGRPDIPADKKTGKAKKRNNLTQEERAENYNTEQEKMTASLADIITKAGSNLLARADVEAKMQKLGFAVNKVKDLLKLLCGDKKPYCDQPELDRNSKTGRKRHGDKFYTTHELAAEYRKGFERLDI